MSSSMPSPRIIIVTGANRGIGRAICTQILSRPDLGPLKLFATSRKGDLQLPTGENKEVLYPRLDIGDADSIRSFASEVKSHGQVDVLINNAGINLDNEYNSENAKRTIDTNFRGTVNMCRTFLPQMSSQNGRIVNIASVASSIKMYSPAIQERFRSAKSLGELAGAFEDTVSSSTEEQSGFGPPPRSYSVSKALLRAYTNLLATQHPSVLINSCCPGWISTDMGALIGSAKVKPPKTPDQGAQIPLRLAFDDIQGITGKYWANDSVRSKDLGSVQEEW